MYGFLLVFYSNFVPKMHRFWDTRLVSIQWPWNPGWGSFKVIESDTSRSAAYDFLLTFHSNCGPISYRFQDKRRFQSKSAKFSDSRVFVHPLNGFPLELDTGAGAQKLEWWGYRVQKEVWRYLQPCGYNPPTWQTHTERQQRRRLRIASCGKK